MLSKKRNDSNLKRPFLVTIFVVRRQSTRIFKKLFLSLRTMNTILTVDSVVTMNLLKKPRLPNLNSQKLRKNGKPSEKN
jgi:hypothetical protein